MNHQYIDNRLKSGEIFISGTCCKCGQERRKYINSGTMYFRQLDGTWGNHRPAPCTREHKMALLAAQIDELVEFVGVEKKDAAI